MKAWTKRYLHFEQNTASKAESAYSTVKRNLGNFVGDMLIVVTSIEHTVKRLHYEAEASMEQAVMSPAVMLKNPLFCDVMSKV